MDQNNSNKSIKINIDDKNKQTTLTIPSVIPKIPHTNYQSYDPVKTAKTIIDIATQPDLSVHEICERNNINSRALYAYMLVNNDIADAYYRAKKIRATGEVDNLRQTTEQLIAKIEDVEDSMDVRKADLRIRLHRVDSINVQYQATKLNKERYGDRQEIEHKGLDPVAVRVEAWRKLQEAKKTEFKEIIDTQPSEQDT